VTDSTVQSVFPVADWQTASPESQGVDPQRLAEAIARLEAITLEEGVSQTMVVRHGRVIWAGPDIDNLHPVWSCSKSFTSACLGLLVDDGAVDLDEPVANHLPALAEHYPTATFRHFAAFTVGYAHRAAAVDGQPAWPFVPAAPLFAPGERYIYGMATDVLAWALTRIAGEGLAELFRRRIARPIGIPDDQWAWGDWGFIDGLRIHGGSGCYAKGLWITARQMARVGWLWANGGRWGDRQILSRAYVDQATRPQSTPDTPPHDGEAWYKRLPGSYGLNLWVNGLTPDGRRQWPAAPPSTSAIQGNNNNICFILPDWNMVLVRLGTDGIISTDLYDGVLEILGEAIGA